MAAKNKGQNLSVHSAASSPTHESTARPFDAKLCSKLDFHILTPIFFLNFLSLMGRTNIGSALIQQLPQDLKLDATKLFLVIVMPLIMLIIFDIPSNLIMRWLEKRFGLAYMRYLSLITVLLGVVTLGQAFVQSYGAMLATRFLVGFFDTGLIPGCVYILGLYYPSVRLQWRMSMLMVANIVSNIISGILAYGIAQIHSSNGYHGWRWIFMVEGLITVVVGAICMWSNVSSPEKSTFLSQEEKEIIAETVESRKSTIGLAAEWKIFLSSPLNYAWAAMFVFTCATTYSISLFAPSIIQAFHPDWNTPEIQGQVIPIFVVSSAAALLAGYGADRLNHRLGFALTGYAFTIIGYAILRKASEVSSSIQLLALYFASLGTYTAMPMVWALSTVNQPSRFQQALGAGFVISIGNSGGFVSSWSFRSSEAPHYAAGMTNCLVLTCVAAGLAILALVYIKVANRRTSAPEEGVEKSSSGNAPMRYRP
ncbi:putative Major facilitator superfamily domain-containing protein [Seiridium cardinale]|uniref:Major facilitator superfamily domain-containing protein n=1 Tax=Seiridium cardinale TaxID=138064 RepID=A0ABR2XDA4_9PEZI